MATKKNVMGVIVPKKEVKHIIIDIKKKQKPGWL